MGRAETERVTLLSGLGGDGREVAAALEHLLGMADALAKTVRKPRERELASVVRSAVHGARRSQIASDQTDLCAVIELVVERFFPLARARGVALWSAVGPDVPAIVETNTTALTRALEKRLANALSEPAGAIGVRIAIVPSPPDTRCVRIEVTVGDEPPLVLDDIVVRELAATRVGETRRPALLVEPPSATADALCEHLDALAFDVEHVVTASAALERLKTRRFDLALVDGALDAEVAERITRHLGAGGTPTLLIVERSALTSPIFAHHHAVLSRPIPWSRLREAAFRALGRTLRSSVSSSSRDLTWSEGSTRKTKSRILVVEDSPTNCRLIARMLEHSGHTCDLAEDGLQAVNACKSVPYDLVLMDVRMPNLDGFQATRTIRRELGPSPPVVALTGDTSLEVRDRCEAAGMNDFLAKPVDPTALADVLVRFLD